MMTGRWNATLYDSRHAFVASYGEDLVGVLAPSAGECILDLGCGTGQLTQAIADTGARVVGLDSSEEMIAAAHAKYPELTFVLGDAADFATDERFDAVFSNAALHWVRDADRAAACMARSLRSGGRLVAEFGGSGNIAKLVNAVGDTRRRLGLPTRDHGWYFPTVGEYAAVLESNGFLVRAAYLYDRPTRLDRGPDGLRAWLMMFGAELLGDLDEAGREALVADVEETLKGELYRDEHWHLDYRRLRVVAEKAEAERLAEPS
jgi:trans-aconitate methyltransferase